MQECGVAELFEVSKVFAGGTAHRIHHFFAQLHWRRKWFGITTQDETKVNVKQFS